MRNRNLLDETAKKLSYCNIANEVQYDFDPFNMKRMASRQKNKLNLNLLCLSKEDIKALKVDDI
jgi:hypothetical protein